MVCPFRGYANAIRDELPEAITVLDAFHVVKFGSAMVDEVRRRVQQDTLGRRGCKGDPLYGSRRTLQTGAEHLTDKQDAGTTGSSPSGPEPRSHSGLPVLPEAPPHLLCATPARGRELVIPAPLSRADLMTYPRLAVSNSTALAFARSASTPDFPDLRMPQPPSLGRSRWQRLRATSPRLKSSHTLSLLAL